MIRIISLSHHNVDSFHLNDHKIIQPAFRRQHQRHGSRRRRNTKDADTATSFRSSAECSLYSVPEQPRCVCRDGIRYPRNGSVRRQHDRVLVWNECELVQLELSIAHCGKRLCPNQQFDHGHDFRDYLCWHERQRFRCRDG